MERFYFGQESPLFRREPLLLGQALAVLGELANGE